MQPRRGLLRAFLALASIHLAVTSPISTNSPATGCVNPRVRKEWRNFASSQQLEYLDAVKCLMNTPSEQSDVYTGSTSRFDDFLGLHISQTGNVHFCGQFLPWHRYFLQLYQNALEDACGYTGPIPYWNWALDATGDDPLVSSPLFDATYGFGGNGPYIANVSGFPIDYQSLIHVPGRTGGGCVADGPFANFNVSMGPGNHTEYNPHCLRRDFSPIILKNAANQSVIDLTLTATDFWHLDRFVQGTSLELDGMMTHGAGHTGIGGQVGETRYSILITGALTGSDWPARNTSIGGPDKMWSGEYAYFGYVEYENITLDTPLYFDKMAEPITVRDTMDTENGLFCYVYE
ncbi:Tyrosinase [Cytospora mali]|uniref:Tyrosinase n=1 Tax=Cytospora mali TaxID=578113 RepID=A0A194V5Z8_CYTMA|nr:Tyrosinase [Valsa mali var. pyri (nom. inval.)]